jgi:excisionase family DNA binding protein
LLTAKEAAAVLGIGRTKLYELLGAGAIESVRIDGCRRVPREAVEEFVARLRSKEAA